MEIAVLAAIGVVLLVGMVALAVGNRGWSIGTVVAAFLVLFSAVGYLYLATRLAARDAAWARSVSDLEKRLAEVRDGQRAGADGRLEPLPGATSLTALRQERDRWLRTAATVDTWRDRFWTNASFEPEPGDGPRLGARIVVPRPPRPAPAGEGGAPPAADAAPQPGVPPLLTPGASIFVFDDSTLAEGGRYLGAFTIREATIDAGIDSQVIKATLIGEPNERERRLLAEPHGPVTVYDRLPVDRWIAFYRTQPPAEGVAPGAGRPRDDVAAAFDGIDDDQVQTLVRAFLDRFERHDAEVPEPQWAECVAELADGTAMPGTYWAAVAFTQAHSFSDGAAGATPREFTSGEQAEFDLATAMDLRDRGLVKIERVLRRRPLADAMAAIYGTQVVSAEAGGARAVQADGALALARQLRADTLVIENAGRRLADALKATQSHTATMEDIAGQLRDDLESWQRDVTAATGLADAFAASVDRTTRARQDADRAIVALGAELSAAMSRLAAEINLVAPPPAR
jgi:hypothetical protein